MKEYMNSVAFFELLSCVTTRGQFTKESGNGLAGYFQKGYMVTENRS